MKVLRKICPFLPICFYTLWVGKPWTSLWAWDLQTGVPAFGTIDALCGRQYRIILFRSRTHRTRSHTSINSVLTIMLRSRDAEAEHGQIVTFHRDAPPVSPSPIPAWAMLDSLPSHQTLRLPEEGAVSLQ